MNSQGNRDYWNKWNLRYSDVWKSYGRMKMSAKELTFIKNYLDLSRVDILDIGVGNGRILAEIIKSSSTDSQIYGVDISESMVEICQDKFKSDPKIKQISVCDLSVEPIPFNPSFDLVTMIRVLKYNQNWPDIISKVINSLGHGGVFIFTMPNKFSISILSGDRFSDNNTPIQHGSISQMREISEINNVKLIEVRGFSKLPNFLYHLSNNHYFVNILLSLEFLLEKILGKAFLGRELFYVIKRN